MKTKELISLMLITYNQEKYIEEALKGLLNQTYSPLEIIISDDCSTDKTFEIIKKTVSEYNGLHKIIINKNETNLGLIKHFNKIISMCHGDFIVIAAGDDISLPNRVQVIYDKWNKERDSIMAIVSSSYTIDSEGKELTPSLFEIKEDRTEDDFYTGSSLPGACVAYSSKIFKTFGNINYDCYEDMVCYRRALMLGKVLFLKDKLIKYRIGGISTDESNIPNNYTEFKNLKYKELKRASKVVEQLIEDVYRIKDNEKKQSLIYINNIQKKRIKFYETKSILKKLLMLLKLMPCFIIKRKNIIKQFNFKSHHWFRMIKDLLPDSVNNLFYKDNYWLKKYLIKNKEITAQR